MQAPEHQLSRCPKCGADRGEDCVTLDGLIAEKVHYGRPYWSGKVIRPWERRRELLEDDLPATPGGWGGCSRCGHWMLVGPGLPVACVVCRSAA